MSHETSAGEQIAKPRTSSVRRWLRAFRLPKSSGLKSKNRFSSGFTLIELLTVLSIIAIMTTIVSVNLSSARKQARDVRRKTDLQAIQSAIELYANANGGKVPVSISPSNSINVSGGNWISGADLSMYLSTLPVDPINTDPYTYTYQTGPAGSTKQYSYALDATLESEPTTSANLTTAPSSDNSSMGFYVTGTYVGDNNTVHYRVSSGASN